MTVRLKIIQLCTNVWTRKCHRGKFMGKPSRKQKCYDCGICKFVDSAVTFISRWETSRWQLTIYTTNLWNIDSPQLRFSPLASKNLRSFCSEIFDVTDTWKRKRQKVLRFSLNPYETKNFIGYAGCKTNKLFNWVVIASFQRRNFAERKAQVKPMLSSKQHSNKYERFFL